MIGVLRHAESKSGPEQRFIVYGLLFSRISVQSVDLSALNNASEFQINMKIFPILT